ncbi:MAG TPA: hypothetical protein VMT68_13030 [Caulobacteraceae bacterium]|nr:hypothetical protein [Caulobacteraceae bacterium]
MAVWRSSISGATLLRVGAIAAGIGFAAALSACGAPADNSAAGQQFVASFDKSLHDSCVSSFTSKGGPADKAESYCGCVVQQANLLPNADKMSLPMHPDKMQQMAQTCTNQVVSGAAAATNSQ